MIPITPQIIGPGIDEEYADAMKRIEQLEQLLKAFPASNDTPEGRMVYQLMWLRQEIIARRLPIPLKRKYWSTLGRLIAEGTLDHLGCERPMGNLATILKGAGLVKPRHYPVVVAMIDDLLTVERRVPTLTAIERQFLDDTRSIRAAIISGNHTIPFDESKYDGWKHPTKLVHLSAIDGFDQQCISLGGVLFSEWRPAAARKGPLAAPNPGMVWGN